MRTERNTRIGDAAVKEEISSNYEKLSEQWRRDFLGWDQEAMCRKLGITDYDEDSIRLSYFGIRFRIDRKTGLISRPGEPEYVPSFNTQMAIYHLLFYSSEHPRNSGEWVNFREVKNAGVFEKAFEKIVLRPFAQAFDGRTEAFEEAGRKLGFVPIPYGDAAFEVPAFSCIPIRVMFWDGDEEFPAKLTMLFDRNITQFTHPETVVLLAEECMGFFLKML